MYICVRGIQFTFFYDFLDGLWYCSVFCPSFYSISEIGNHCRLQSGVNLRSFLCGKTITVILFCILLLLDYMVLLL